MPDPHTDDTLTAPRPDCHASLAEPCHTDCSSRWDPTSQIDAGNLTLLVPADLLDADPKSAASPDPPTSRPTPPSSGRTAGARSSPAPGPYHPIEPHSHYRQGHWTRDGRLVLACCGLDGT